MRLICCSINAEVWISQKSFHEKLISKKILYRNKDLALSASDSSLLLVGCKEVIALRNVAGEGNDFAVGRRNSWVSVSVGTTSLVSDDVKQWRFGG